MNNLFKDLGKWLSDQGIEEATKMSLTVDWENAKMEVRIESLLIGEEAMMEFAARKITRYELKEKVHESRES